MRYLVHCMIQDKGDKRAYCASSTEVYLSVDEAMKVVNKYRQNYTVLCAWIKKEGDDLPIFFENYTDILGGVINHEGKKVFIHD